MSSAMRALSAAIAAGNYIIYIKLPTCLPSLRWRHERLALPLWLCPDILRVASSRLHKY